MNSSRMSASAAANESATGPALRLQAGVLLTSVDHGHTSVRSSVNNFNVSHGPSNADTPNNSLSNRSRRDSPSGTPSHRARASNASAFFSPPASGELVESGFSATATRRAPSAAAIPSAPNASVTGAAEGRNGNTKTQPASVSAPDIPREKKGRRSSRQGNANWFESETATRPADTELNQNVATVNDGVADQELARREQAERAQRQQEQLTQHISDPPTGFQATLPRLSELDVTNSWDKLLRMMRNEYDMSCLTSCLARELDEDVAWNPEMLLVQLTSDLMDAAELQKDNEVYVPVDASDIGQMTGGEVVRKRGEKTAVVQGSGAAGGGGAAPGAAANAAASPNPAIATKRSAAALGGSGGDGGVSPKNGAAASKMTASVVGPGPQAKQSPSKRETSAASKAGSAATSKMDVKPMSTKKSVLKSFLKR